jgi:hypothetical protein
MEVELYLIGKKAQLNLLYYKIKLSREGIEKSHPNRIDLIQSMKQSELDALEALEAFQYLDKNWRSTSQRNYQLERLNLELLNEVAKLKITNKKLIDRVNL